MQIEGFRAVAERPNAIVVVDSKSAQVKVRSNHVFNRAITWLRERFSPDPLRHATTDAARTRFLQAIAHRNSGYDSTDVNRARELLTDDSLERRPLSSRRIREVLDDLDGRSSPTTRVNRRVASIYQEATGRPATLAVRDLAASSQPERAADTLSLYGDPAGAAPPGAADEPGDSESSSEAGTAREDVMADPLPEPYLATSMEGATAPEALVDPPSPTTSTESTAVPGHPSPTTTSAEGATAVATAETPAPGVGRTTEPQAAKAEAGTTAGIRATQKQLTREVARARLPGEVAKPLRRLIASKEIVDSAGLAKHGNKLTAQAVVENRVGEWYVDALKAGLKDKGIRRMAKREGTVYVPSSLLNKVARSITDSPALKRFPEIKAEARTLITAHVEQEINEGTVAPEAVVRAGAGPDAPAHRTQKA